MKDTVFFLTYTIVYLFLTFATLADGKGTFVFVSPLIVWLLFIFAFILVRRPNKRKKELSVIIYMMTLFYLGTAFIAIIEQTGEGNFERMVSLLNRNPLLVSITLLWFVSGQAIFWSLLIHKIRTPVNSP